jgi:hypothetical protein
LPATTAPGQRAWLQIRVHEAAFGPQYDAAIAAPPIEIGGIRRTAIAGKSALFSIVTGTPQTPAPIVSYLITFNAECQVMPQIVVEPADQTVPLRGQATFQAQPVCGTGVNYDWRKEGQSIGIHQRTLVLTNVGAADAGGYSVVLSNVCGSVTSRVANLTIVPAFTQWSRAGGLRLEIKALPNRTVTLLDSSNLQTWTEAGSVVVDGNGAATITQAVSPAVLQRFYRIRDP